MRSAAGMPAPWGMNSLLVSPNTKTAGRRKGGIRGSRQHRLAIGVEVIDRVAQVIKNGLTVSDFAQRVRIRWTVLRPLLSSAEICAND